MKFIIPILIGCFSVSACKNKELSSDYLSNIHVVRQTEDMRKATPSDTPVQVREQPSKTGNEEAKATYHVIVASFSYSEKSRAERLVEQLREQGYPAGIINSAQRYRVSIESFRTEAAANAARDEYRAITDRQDIWVLK